MTKPFISNDNANVNTNMLKCLHLVTENVDNKDYFRAQEKHGLFVCCLFILALIYRERFQIRRHHDSFPFSFVPAFVLFTTS